MRRHLFVYGQHYKFYFSKELYKMLGQNYLMIEKSLKRNLLIGGREHLCIDKDLYIEIECV